jgi:hypothetical protein
MSFVVKIAWVIFLCGLYLICTAFNNAHQLKMSTAQGMSALGVLFIIFSCPFVFAYLFVSAIDHLLHLFI